MSICLQRWFHDHYCYKENHVRGWRQTHKAFYYALNTLGVPALKAKIMYAAVYLGGPEMAKACSR
jgi:hypothetical protein